MNPQGFQARRVWALVAALLLFGAVFPAPSAEIPAGEAAAIRTSAANADAGAALADGALLGTATTAWFEFTADAQLTARDAVLGRLAAQAARVASAAAAGEAAAEARQAAAAAREAAAREAAAREAAAAAAAAAAARAAAAAKAVVPRAVVLRNHFWFPSLGMSQPVYLYACSRSTPPDNYLYRWGCAGQNNLYLLGHAGSVMKPLHDAYVEGRLRVGMVAMYADAYGRITRYAVTAWQVVTPDVVAWASAAQPVPSMTLQTCVGTYSQYRLDVRLVRVP